MSKLVTVAVAVLVAIEENVVVAVFIADNVYAAELVDVPDAVGVFG